MFFDYFMDGEVDFLYRALEEAQVNFLSFLQEVVDGKRKLSTLLETFVFANFGGCSRTFYEERLDEMGKLDERLRDSRGEQIVIYSSRTTKENFPQGSYLIGEASGVMPDSGYTFTSTAIYDGVLTGKGLEFEIVDRMKDNPFLSPPCKQGVIVFPTGNKHRVILVKSEPSLVSGSVESVRKKRGRPRVALINLPHLCGDGTRLYSYPPNEFSVFPNDSDILIGDEARDYLRDINFE